MYRRNTQPRADIDIFMQKIIEIQSTIKEENKISYLMGDFNIDLLKVNLHAKTNKSVNDVFSQGFLPKITRPTRITPHSATLIDHNFIYKLYIYTCIYDIQMTTCLHLKTIYLKLLLLMWLITSEHSILLASANKHPYKNARK